MKALLAWCIVAALLLTALYSVALCAALELA